MHSKVHLKELFFFASLSACQKALNHNTVSFCLIWKITALIAHFRLLQHCYLDEAELKFTSGVPQNVEVVPLCSMFSLQSPKSVKTMCPWESSKMFSGFKSLKQTEREMKQMSASHTYSSKQFHSVLKIQFFLMNCFDAYPSSTLFRPTKGISPMSHHDVHFLVLLTFESFVLPWSKTPALLVSL